MAYIVTKKDMYHIKYLVVEESHYSKTFTWGDKQQATIFPSESIASNALRSSGANLGVKIERI
jgi:hypothetical protein